MALPQTRAALKAADRLAIDAVRLRRGPRGAELNLADHRFIIPALSEWMHQVSHAIDAEADSVRATLLNTAAYRSTYADDLTSDLAAAAKSVRHADYPINHGAAVGIQRDIYHLHIRDHDDAMSQPGWSLRHAAGTAIDTAAEWHSTLGRRSTLGRDQAATMARHAVIVDMTGALITEMDITLAAEAKLIAKAYRRIPAPAAPGMAAAIIEPFTTARRTLRRASCHLDAALDAITAAVTRETWKVPAS
jgi:hypothetical protein